MSGAKRVMSVGARVDDLVSRMTGAEKIGCIGTKTCDLPRLGISMTWAEALHGLRYNCITDLAGRPSPLCATSFPHAQLLAASFNRSLWSAVGGTIATEARAFHNLWASGRQSSSRYALSFFAPDINLCRDPRWGRCLEVPGEDPLLSAEYAVRYVAAMQERHPQTNATKAFCNAKHWSSYDVERGATDDGAGEPYNRGSFDAIVTKQDLAQTYWPQFRAAATRAGLGGVMCSYNAVNGVPSCANSEFNNGVLRSKFGFDGMIVSDCGPLLLCPPLRPSLPPCIPSARRSLLPSVCPRASVRRALCCARTTAAARNCSPHQ